MRVSYKTGNKIAELITELLDENAADIGKYDGLSEIAVIMTKKIVAFLDKEEND